METKHDPDYCEREAEAKARRRDLLILIVVCMFTLMVFIGPGDAFMGG